MIDFAEVVVDLSALQNAGRFKEAAELALVAADAAEERGWASAAVRLRKMGWMSLVVAYARRRWPREDIRLQDVSHPGDLRAGVKPTTFTIRRVASTYVFYTWVSILRNGKVRVLEGASRTGRP